MKVAGITVGKGFQGGIKSHNFSRGPVSHGSHNVRAPGSIGASAFPARVFKGMRMPGQMGNKRRTQRGLEIASDRRRAQPSADQGLRPRRQELDRRGTDRWLVRKLPCSANRPKSDLPDELFAEPFHQSLVHEAARADLASRRRGTASTLTRGEVAFTTAKAWRQKGTGRARVGTLGVSSRFGGGVTFGPKPRHYTVKVNRKARRRAMRSALSVHAERGSVAVFDAAGFDTPSTKSAARRARPNGAPSNPILIILTAEETGAMKSFRNIPRTTVIEVGATGVADVIGAAAIVISETALVVVRGAARRFRGQSKEASA